MTLSKRNSGTGAFLYISRNFEEDLFCRTCANVCLSEMMQRKLYSQNLFTGKLPVMASFLVQLQTYVGLQFYQKGLYHRCISAKIVKFYRASFLSNTVWRLLLIYCSIFDVSFGLSMIYQFSHSQLSRTFRSSYSQAIHSVCCKNI